MKHAYESGRVSRHQQRQEHASKKPHETIIFPKNGTTAVEVSQEWHATCAMRTLYAFSFEQEPHMAVKTLAKPAGATRMKLSSSSVTQSVGGIRPRDGRFTMAVAHSSDRAA